MGETYFSTRPTWQSTLLDGRVAVSMNGLRLSRWRGDVFLEIESPTPGVALQPIFTSVHGTEWHQRGMAIATAAYAIRPICPDSPGDLEYEIRLMRRPSLPIIRLCFRHSDNLEFFFQPEQPKLPGIETDPIANPGELDFGQWRGSDIWPEVLNSWAVYHTSRRGDPFRAGKAFHIFRPKIFDAQGRMVWGEINIDPLRGHMDLLIPPEFWRSATYPLLIDPTFGYETAGTAGNTTIETGLVGSIFQSNMTGTIQTISIYSNPSSTARTFSAAVYNADTLALVNGETANTPSGTGAAWRDVTMSPEPSVTPGQNYILICWGTQSTGTHVIQYDAGSSGQGKIDANTSAFTWPDPIVPSTTNNNMYSIHADGTGPQWVPWTSTDDLNAVW